MAAKTPPWTSYPKWTTARYWGFIRAHLRRAWLRWPPRYECLNKAKSTATGETRRKHEYQCSKCKEWFPQAQVEVDHITPCGSLNEYSDLVSFVERLFVSEEKLRVVCKPCHRELTNEHK